MARVTVDDCMKYIENRFELVLTAAKRARQLHLGAEPKVPPEENRPAVLALREISEGKIGPEILQEETLFPDLPDLFDDDMPRSKAPLNEDDLFGAPAGDEPTDDAQPATQTDDD